MSLERLIAIELGEVGVRETGINFVKYNDWYWGQGVGGSDYPWCVAFQCWCAKQAEVEFPTTAHCKGVREFAQSRGQWVSSGFRTGDFVIVGGDRHIGFVLEANGNNLVTIEGNYSDMVSKVNRRSSEFVGAYRPNYEDSEYIPEPSEKSEEAVKDTIVFKLRTINCNSYDQKLPEIAIIQGILKKCGYDCGELDGETGPKTLAMVKNFQYDRRLEVDGVVGPNTWSELFMGVDW